METTVGTAPLGFAAVPTPWRASPSENGKLPRLLAQDPSRGHTPRREG